MYKNTAMRMSHFMFMDHLGTEFVCENSESNFHQEWRP